MAVWLPLICVLLLVDNYNDSSLVAGCAFLLSASREDFELGAVLMNYCPVAA